MRFLDSSNNNNTVMVDILNMLTRNLYKYYICIIVIMEKNR